MKERKKEKRKRVGLPDAFVLREGALVARGTVSEGGVPLMVYTLSLPAFAKEGTDPKEARAQKRLTSFYVALALQLWRACEERLFSFVRLAYAESDDPHKRYRFPRYTLTVDFTLEEGDEEICVLRRAVLSRRGRTVCERTWQEHFYKKNGQVILGRFSRFLSRLKPQKGLKGTLKSVISRHTGGG